MPAYRSTGKFLQQRKKKLDAWVMAKEAKEDAGVSITNISKRYKGKNCLLHVCTLCDEGILCPAVNVFNKNKMLCAVVGDDFFDDRSRCTRVGVGAGR